MDSDGGTDQELAVNGNDVHQEANAKDVLLNVKTSKTGYGSLTNSADGQSDISSVSSVDALDHDDLHCGKIILSFLFCINCLRFKNSYGIWFNMVF